MWQCQCIILFRKTKKITGFIGENTHWPEINDSKMLYSDQNDVNFVTLSRWPYLEHRSDKTWGLLLLLYDESDEKQLSKGHSFHQRDWVYVHNFA